MNMGNRPSIEDKAKKVNEYVAHTIIEQIRMKELELEWERHSIEDEQEDI